jgi:hypothetical protein
VSRLTGFLKAMIGMDNEDSTGRRPEAPSAAEFYPNVERPFDLTSEQSAIDGAFIAVESPEPAEEAQRAESAGHAPPEKLEAVLGAFGIRRTRDLDALLCPARATSAFLWTTGCIVLLTLVGVGNTVLADAADRLELGDHPQRIPMFIAGAVAVIAIIATMQLVVRIRRAERRRLFQHLCAEWIREPGVETIERYFSDRFQVSLKRIAAGNRTPSN